MKVKYKSLFLCYFKIYSWYSDDIGPVLQVVEFDRPYTLLCKEDGVLADLALQTGEESRDKLLEIAKQNHTADT